MINHCRLLRLHKGKQGRHGEGEQVRVFFGILGSVDADAAEMERKCTGASLAAWELPTSQVTEALRGCLHHVSANLTTQKPRAIERANLFAAVRPQLTK